jgi:hypothetical protein
MFLHGAGEEAEAQLLARSVLDAKTRLGVYDDARNKAKELLADIERTGNAD